MTFKESLLQELENTPEPIVKQVLNFLRFLKTSELAADRDQLSASQPRLNRTSLPDRDTQYLSDEERLARLNKLFGAWKDQPDLAANFAQIDRERHAYHGRQLDSLNSSGDQ